jgi:hypothetical protein
VTISPLVVLKVFAWITVFGYGVIIWMGEQTGPRKPFSGDAILVRVIIAGFLGWAAWAA